MSQSVIEFIAVSIALATLIAAWIVTRKTRKELEQAQAFNLELMQDIGRGSLECLKLRVENKGLQDQNRKLQHELETAVAWSVDLYEELDDRKRYPLRGLTDDQLVEVIREELTARVEAGYIVEWAYGFSSESPFWKIASKVGGAAFRVVDKAKRGKLEVQQ